MTSRSHSEPGLQEHLLAATSLVDGLGERWVAQRIALAGHSIWRGQGVDCFAAWERKRSVNNAIFGAVPDHPFLQDLVSSLERRVRRLPDADPEVTQSGPVFFTQVLGRHPEVTIFPARLFYPYQWHERWRRYEEFPDAYAVHHWWLTWRRVAWPKRRAPGDGTAPCLSVVVFPRDAGPRLEWVLEALSAQTVSDFETIVVDSEDPTTVAELIESLRKRMEIVRCVAHNDGQVLGRASAWRAALPLVRSKRALLLDGDRMPDLNVVESHAALGELPFVPFGFRRAYPLDKLFAPVEALRRWARSSRDRGDGRGVLRWLWREQYRLLPLWTGGDVTRMGVDSDDPSLRVRPTRPSRHGLDRYGVLGDHPAE